MEYYRSCHFLQENFNIFPAAGAGIFSKAPQAGAGGYCGEYASKWGRGGRDGGERGRNITGPCGPERGPADQTA